MSRLRLGGSPSRRTELSALVGLFQGVAGAIAAYVSFVLVPGARESFDVGPVAFGQSVQMVAVPAGLALATFVYARRAGVPSVGSRDVGLLFAVSSVSYYVGFWGVGYFVPTPGGRLPIYGGFVAWLLFERSPYLLLAWISFLKPGIDGAIATLAGVGTAALFTETSG